ncbi:MAG: triose-phosphate isomerase [Patescibacteria group bacterium]
MLIVANWKAFVETKDKAGRLLVSAKRISAQHHHDIVLAPPAPFLGLLAGTNRSKVAFAAQDVSATLGGAETGEVTAPVLAGFKVSHVIIGHSERRARGDTDVTVLEKVRRALAHGLTPILCIGEKTRDDDGAYLQFLRSQLSAIYEPLTLKERLKIIVAYEPIWAINHDAGEAIGHADLTEMVLYIRKLLSEYLPGKGSTSAKILYGGSVETGNARDLAASSGIDGFLVGHASTDTTTFTALCKAVS